MSVSAHIAAQRTDHAVPHAVSCRALGVAASTFYKWHNRPPTPAQRRRAELDVEVKACFDASDGTYGSPRVRAELRRSGREVSKKTVESSMARQGLQGRARRRRRGLTRPDKRAGPVPDLLRRDFTAGGVDEKWVGDFKQIDTAEGPVFIATVEDLFSRRMLGFAQSDRHPTAQLATDAINMAAAVRGGGVAGVIFHTDKGPIYLRRVRGGLRQAQDHPIDGTRRLRAGQRRRRVVLLDAPARADITPPLAHPRPGPTRHRRLDRHLVHAVRGGGSHRKRLHSTNNMTSPIDYELANAA